MATSSKGKPRTFIKRLHINGGPDATLVVHWNPDVTMNPPSEACSVSGSVAGGLSLELHLLYPSDPYYVVWHEWTDVTEDSGHVGQQVRLTDWTPPWGSPCAPTPGPGQSLSSFAGWLPSPSYHNSSWTITARYGWRTFLPPSDPQYAEVRITVNFNNLRRQPDATNPVGLAWDPDDPTKRQTRVKMDLSESQRVSPLVRVRIEQLACCEPSGVGLEMTHWTTRTSRTRQCR